MKPLSGLQQFSQLAMGLTLFLASMTLSGCGGGSTPAAKPPVVTPPVTPQLSSISLTPAAVSVNVGQTDQFVATAKYSDGTSAAITPDSWTSSDPSILTISPSGLGTAVGYGQPTVTATFSGVTGNVPISVHGGSLSVTITGTNAGLVTLTSSTGATSSLSQSGTVALAPGNVTVFGNGSTIGNLRYLPITQSQTVALPDGGTASVTVDYSAIVPTTTKLLDAAGMSSLQISSDQGTITLSSTSAVAAGLAPQDILIVDICDAAPSGLLVLVDSVTTGNGTVTATVEPAALTDAIQQGSFSISQALGPATLTEMSRNQLSHLRRHPFSGATATAADATGTCDGNSDAVKAAFKKDLVKDQSGSLTLSGELDLCTDITFDAKWDSGSLDTLDAKVIAAIHTDTELTSTFMGAIGPFDPDLPGYTGKPIRFLVAGFPVVVTPSLTPVLKASGTADAMLSSGLTTDTTTTLAVSYANGTWNAPVSSGTPTNVAHTTSASVNADIKASAGFRVDLALYQNLPINATVSIEPDAYLELKAGTNSNPCWTLNGGLDGEIGVKGRFLSRKLGPYTTGEKNLFDIPIAQAKGPCYKVNVTPTLSTLTEGQTLQLSASEVDLLGNSVTNTFNWSTADASVATVDQNGLVTAVGSGDTMIMATDPKSMVSGTAQVSVGCSGPCYQFTFPEGIPADQTFTIYFYGTTITPSVTPIVLSNLQSGATYTLPVGQYYPTTPSEQLSASVLASGPIHYQLSIPAPFVFEITTLGVNFQLDQSSLDYTFPAPGGQSSLFAYVPTP